MGLIKLVGKIAGIPFEICVEKLISFISTSDFGVTSPLNKASIANGTDGKDVGEGVGEVAGVAVRIKTVGIFSRVFAGAAV